MIVTVARIVDSRREAAAFVRPGTVWDSAAQIERTILRNVSELRRDPSPLGDGRWRVEWEVEV